MQHLMHQMISGEMAEWLKAADCKSARVRVRRFESFSLHHLYLSGDIDKRV